MLLVNGCLLATCWLLAGCLLATCWLLVGVSARVTDFPALTERRLLIIIKITPAHVTSPLDHWTTGPLKLLTKNPKDVVDHIPGVNNTKKRD